jgi:hypothetical protein
MADNSMPRFGPIVNCVDTDRGFNPLGPEDEGPVSKATEFPATASLAVTSEALPVE